MNPLQPFNNAAITAWFDLDSASSYHQHHTQLPAAQQQPHSESDESDDDEDSEQEDEFIDEEDVNSSATSSSRLIDYMLLVGLRDDVISQAIAKQISPSSSSSSSTEGQPESADMNGDNDAFKIKPEILQQYPPLPRSDVSLSASTALVSLPGLLLISMSVFGF